MSRGPGTIEQRIADLFAETRDHALSVEDICNHAFKLKGRPASRAQRLSATRAAHRLVRRSREAQAKADALRATAHEATEAALGRKRRFDKDRSDTEFSERLEADPAWIEAERDSDFADRIGRWVRFVRHPEKPGHLFAEIDFWCATVTPAKRLWFHPPDVPVRVWAVSIQPAGVIWAEAEIVKITERNVMVRYAGELARLDREKLWRWWSFWRAVRFVSSRTGRIAAALDEVWWSRYGTAGSVPPAMQMPLADAIALLGVPLDYTEDDVIAAFRREVKKAHPDAGGTAEQFRALVEARDRLLAALGTKAPAPKMPTYAPKGVQVIYRVARRRESTGIGSRRRLLLGG